MVGDEIMLEIILIVAVVSMLVLNVYILNKSKRIKEEPLTTKELEYRRDMSDHMDALLNYTPEIAYRKVKHG